jgi:hypothetical protein
VKSRDKQPENGKELSELEKFFLYWLLKSYSFLYDWGFLYPIKQEHKSNLLLSPTTLSTQRHEEAPSNALTAFLYNARYADINISAGCQYFIGGTGGIIFEKDGHTYIYIGGGIVSPKPSAAITLSTYSVSRGFNLGVQATSYLSFQGGYSFKDKTFYREYGGGYPVGLTIALFYIWKLK